MKIQRKSSSSEDPEKIQFLSRSQGRSSFCQVPGSTTSPSSCQVPGSTTSPSSCQVPGSTTSPIPSIRLRNISSSSRIQDESDPIDPTHQSSSSQGASSSQGQVPVQFLSRSSSCQVPGSTSSPIPSIRLRNISSSSRIHDESDPIDPTHQSSSSQGASSSQGQVPVQFRSRIKFLSSSWIHVESDPIDPTQKHKFQFPDPRRVRSHRSDSPVQFLSRSGSCQGQGPVPVPIPGSKSVPDSAIRVRSHRSDSVLLFSLRFQVPDRTEINCFSWWFDSGIQKSISVASTTTSSAQKFGPALHRPSPTTYPENSTNPCAELVEAESLVICEEITWRPLFFWSLWTTLQTLSPGFSPRPFLLITIDIKNG